MSPFRSTLCNLYVSMLDRIAIPIDRFADRTGTLPGLDNMEYTPGRI